MDYRGDYFPDEENEGLSDAAIRRKKIRRIIFYGLAFTIYLIVFIRLFRSCDVEMIDNIYLSEEARQMYERDKDNFIVYKINTKEFMNYDGTIQLKNIVYAETANEFEIGVKYKEKIAKDADGNKAVGYPFDYILEDNLGTKYEICGRVNEKKNGYVYERISFKGVKLDLQYNDLNRKDGEGDNDKFAGEESERNKKLLLTVKNPADDGFSEDPITVYDNSTTYQLIKKVKLSG